MAEMARNQHRTASQGREVGLTLERQGHGVKLVEWGQELLHECAQIAQVLDRQAQDEQHRGHAQACEQVLQRLGQLDDTPSARVLRVIQEAHAGSFLGFGLAQSQRSREGVLQRAWLAEAQAAMQATARRSLDEQRQREAADTLSFEAYREHYLAPEQLLA